MRVLPSHNRKRVGTALIFSALLANAAPAAPQVTFYRNIAPIVYKECAPCHRPGESAPFSLLTYEDVKRRAAQIVDVTKRRFMPPWQPEQGYGNFEEERRLSDAQIQLIREWVEQGALAGTAAHSPALPKFSSEWQLGKPDLVLHVAQPYQLRADGPEVFWNFVIPVPITGKAVGKGDGGSARQSPCFPSCQRNYRPSAIFGAARGKTRLGISRHGSDGPGGHF